MIEMPDRRVKRGLEIWASLHKEMKKRAAAMDIPLWKAFDAAARQWLDKAEPSMPYPYAPANRDLHDKLEAVLNSGDEVAVQAIAPAVELFFARLKPASARRRSGA